MKYVILDLLNDGPRHGYDVIRALEERFGGMYSPSPGSVYPTLQLLEDQGYVSGSELDGKRVYTITDAGRAFLQDRSSVVDDIRAKMHAGWGAFAGPEMRDLVGEVRGLGQFLMSQLAAGGLKDPEKLRKLRETIAKTRSEIEGIFRDNGTPPETL
jgi:DNA-binding PadR family transcriptional regulator